MKNFMMISTFTVFLASCSHNPVSKMETRKPANILDGVKITKVEDVKFLCSSDGGAYAIKTSSPVKIWQGDLDKDNNMKEGIELSNVKLNRLRAKIHDLNFSGILMGVIDVNGHIYLDTDEKSLILDLTTKPLDPAEAEEDEDQSLKMKCKKL